MQSLPRLTSRPHRATWLAAAFALVPLVLPLQSQTTSAPAIGAAATAAEAPVELSPFTVSTSKDTGYLATGTLAGSRLNTSLLDTPASISVMTKDFIADIAATNVGDALAYALNAERDTSESTGNGHGSGDLPLSIRGFGGSSLGRNYFQWGLESDTYNTERLDFSRGPNSILFGTGGPGGIINTTTKRAIFGRDLQQIGLRVASGEDYRATFDVSRQVAKNLAVRVNGVQQSAKSWRDYVGSERKGVALAATFRPFKHTELRFDGEYGEYDRVLTNPYLPGDGLSTWLAGGKQVSATYGAVVTGAGRSTARVYVHDPAGGTVQSWFGSVQTTGAGAALSAAIPRGLTNFSVLPLKANPSGDGNRSDSRFNSTGLFLEQRIGDLWIEAAASRQHTGRLWLTSSNWGDSVIRADANAFLPDGRANPNVGKIYLDSNAQQQTFDFTIDDLRLTAAYTLDLNKHSPWLGSYTVTGLLSRRRNEQSNDNLFEVNLTPVGDAIYPRSLANANNRIYRRTYLDPFGPGRKGGYDARRTQFSQGGVTSGFARIQNQGIVSREELDAQMIAGQAKLLRDRLVVTGGLRHDEQKNFAGTATADAVTGVFGLQTLSATSSDFAGDTKTFGLVLHLTPWAAAFFNRSDNFVPQSTLTIIGDQLGPRLGKGKDFGLKFRLLDGRLYAAFTRYETSEKNRQNFADGNLVSAINEIYEAIGDATRVAGATSRDGIDTEGKGHEFEVTANLTTQWRLSANFSQTQGTQANNQPRLRAYIEARRAGWATQSARPLIAPINGVPVTDPKTAAPSTVATALDSLDTYVKNILAANGVTRRQLREYTGSVFTAYTFRSDRKWLHDLTLGGGARYRDKPVVGYRNGIEPVFGKGDVNVNFMAAKNLRLLNRRVRLQANLDNVLNVNDPIIVDADDTGAYRFLYPNPFRWTLSATINL
jgi:iron complex outermembrane receptor protein